MRLFEIRLLLLLLLLLFVADADTREFSLVMLSLLFVSVDSFVKAFEVDDMELWDDDDGNDDKEEWGIDNIGVCCGNIGVLQLLNALNVASKGVNANRVGVFSWSVGVINKLMLLFDPILNELLLGWNGWPLTAELNAIASPCIKTDVAKEAGDGVINADVVFVFGELLLKDDDVFNDKLFGRWSEDDVAEAFVDVFEDVDDADDDIDDWDDIDEGLGTELYGFGVSKWFRKVSNVLALFGVSMLLVAEFAFVKPAVDENNGNEKLFLSFLLLLIIVLLLKLLRLVNGSSFDRFWFNDWFCDWYGDEARYLLDKNFLSLLCFIISFSSSFRIFNSCWWWFCCCCCCCCWLLWLNRSFKFFMLLGVGWFFICVVWLELFCVEEERDAISVVADVDDDDDVFKWLFTEFV